MLYLVVVVPTDNCRCCCPFTLHFNIISSFYSGVVVSFASLQGSSQMFILFDFNKHFDENREKIPSVKLAFNEYKENVRSVREAALRPCQHSNCHTDTQRVNIRISSVFHT